MSGRRRADDPALERYCAFFERLTVADLDRLDQVFAPEARFADPFNDVRGVAAVREVFERMFERCVDVRFAIHDALRDGDVALLHWTMSMRVAPKRAGGAAGAAWTFHGMSRVRFAADGRVAEHVDHWDSGGQLLARLPLLGPVVRAVLRRLA